MTNGNVELCKVDIKVKGGDVPSYVEISTPLCVERSKVAALQKLKFKFKQITQCCKYKGRKTTKLSPKAEKSFKKVFWMLKNNEAHMWMHEPVKT